MKSLTLERCCDALLLGRENILFVGCYELEGEQRLGQISSFSVDEDAILTSLQLNYGILDMKYEIANDLVVASNSNASISVLPADLSGVRAEIALSNGSIQMGLDLVGNRLITSGTNGSVHILQDLTPIKNFKAHSAEVWTCTFGNANSNQAFWTGSDDCTAKNWDLRTDLCTPTQSIKWHSAGICTVERNPHIEGQFATGSYDDSVAVWDSRNLQRPLQHLKMKGGVWRVKWSPDEKSIVALACMYGGSCLVDLAHEQPKVIREFEVENQNITYGCIFAKKDAVITCSFYDKTLRCYSLL